MTSARMFNCALCRTLTTICSCCDRGHIYCSDECASSARKTSVQSANKRYQDTYAGRANHAARQKRYVARLKNASQKMTDHTSQPPHNILLLFMLAVAARISVLGQNPANIYCDFCGCICSDFVRNNFLRSNVPRRQ